MTADHHPTTPDRLPPLDGLFLDLYGTLTAGDRDAVHATCQRIVDDLDLALSESELAAHWGRRFFELIEQSNHDAFQTLLECERRSLLATAADLAVDIDPAPYVQILEDYWRTPPLHADVVDALAKIRAPICIVSNADHAAAMSAIIHNRLSFDHVVTSEAVRSYKPDAGIFDAALETTGWRRGHVMHLGDSLHSDVGGARLAGIRTGWIKRDVRIHDIGTARPDMTFGTLIDFATWLESVDR
jgi:2-haloacid dehalogenase/putative hydrolase of the HAD superfamily